MGFINIIEKFIGKAEKNSRVDAKKRLQLVLVHDRTDLPFERLEKMKKEIIEVVSKYIDIDMEELELNFENIDECVALVANIPIRKVRKNDE